MKQVHFTEMFTLVKLILKRTIKPVILWLCLVYRMSTNRMVVCICSGLVFFFFWREEANCFLSPIFRKKKSIKIQAYMKADTFMCFNAMSRVQQYRYHITESQTVHTSHSHVKYRLDNLAWYIMDLIPDHITTSD